jgi:hypothetical protein
MLKNMIAFVATAALLVGCVTPKAYVDPNYVKVTAADIKPVAKKHKSKVEVEFKSNGELKPAVHDVLHAKVVMAVRNTGVLETDGAAGDFNIMVVVNNVADTGDAASKGFMTGLTLGAAGSVVTDYYEISISYTDGAGEKKQKSYKHALHTTIGNKEAPFPNVTPTTIDGGFDIIIQQVLLNFVADLQKEGKLTRVPYLRTVAP